MFRTSGIKAQARAMCSKVRLLDLLLSGSHEMVLFPGAPSQRTFQGDQEAAYSGFFVRFVMEWETEPRKSNRLEAA